MNPETQKPEAQKGEWTDVKSKIRAKFGKFNDSEIESLHGHMDQLSDKVQKVYGYGRDQADRESKEFNESLTKKMSAID